MHGTQITPYDWDYRRSPFESNNSIAKQKLVCFEVKILLLSNYNIEN